MKTINFMSKKFNTLLIVLLLIIGYITSIQANLNLTMTEAEKLSYEEKLKQDNIAKAETLEQGGNMAKQCISSLMETENADFCWVKGGNAGHIPTGCPEGFFRYLAMCYKICDRHYMFRDGYCYHGWKIYWPKQYTNFSQNIPCPVGYYKAGALCYKDCNNIGMMNCGIGACSKNKNGCFLQIAQMAIDVVMGVAKLTSFIMSFGSSSAAAVAADKAGSKMAQTLADGLKKRAFDKVKTMMAPQNYAKTIAKAGKFFIESVKDLPLEQAKEWLLDTVCKKVWDAVRENVEKRKEEEEPTEEETDLVKIARNFDTIGASEVYDGCKPKKGTVDGVGCAKAALDFAKQFDPTGLMTIAAAFVLPVCNIDPIVDSVDAHHVNTEPKFDCPSCSAVHLSESTLSSTGLENMRGHDITCPQDQLLNFFTFTTNKNDKLRSHWRCIKPANPVFNCHNQDTPWDDIKWARDGIQFLDRHNVECLHGYLQSFKIETDKSKWQLRFTYTCCMTNNSIPDTTIFYTNKNPLENMSIHMWNRLDGVDANARGAIRSFKPRTDYTSNNGHEMFMEYKTGNVILGDLTEYFENHTEWKDAGDGSIWFLDRHFARCWQNNAAMLNFRLEVNGEEIRFVTKCVKNSKIETDYSEHYTLWSDVGGREWYALNFLDRHLVQCPAGKALMGWTIERQEAPGNLLRIHYFCRAVNNIGETLTNRTFRTESYWQTNYLLAKQNYQPLGPDEVLTGFKLQATWSPAQIDLYFASASLY